jgi:hypothetical protein
MWRVMGYNIFDTADLCQLVNKNILHSWINSVQKGSFVRKKDKAGVVACPYGKGNE